MKPPVRYLIYLVLFAFLGFGFASMMSASSRGRIPMDSAIGLSLLLLVLASAAGYVALMLVILVHELGHLAAGWMAGMRFRGLSVGVFGLSRIEGKWNLFLIRKPMAGGLAFMDWNPDKEMTSSYRLFLLGGPTASLLLAAFAWWIFDATSFSGRPTVSQLVSHTSAMMFLGMSLVILPGTLFPYIAKGFPTDAKLLIMLASKNPDDGRFVAMSLLSRQMMAGVRARDWPSQLVEDAIAKDDGSISHLRALFTAYYHELDSGRPDSAETYLLRAKEISDRLQKQAAFLAEMVDFELVFFRARIRGTDEGAEEVFARLAQPAEFTKTSMHRAKAAVAMLRGDVAAAESELRSYDRERDELFRRYGLRGATDQAWIDEMRASVRDTATATS